MPTATRSNGKAALDELVSEQLVIPPLEITTVSIRVVGDTSLILHKWSEKAKKEMRDKQFGKATEKRAFKDPAADCEAATYRLPDGRPGIPVIAFKAAAVDAATQLSKVTKVFLRGAFHVGGTLQSDELVAIEGEPRMREDMVRIGMGTADLRYRPEFYPWAANVIVRLNARALTVERLAHLFAQAGFSVGVGEWRAAKDGNHGLFHVEGLEVLAS